jgi:hypothetical protein
MAGYQQFHPRQHGDDDDVIDHPGDDLLPADAQQRWLAQQKDLDRLLSRHLERGGGGIPAAAPRGEWRLRTPCADVPSGEQEPGEDPGERQHIRFRHAENLRLHEQVDPEPNGATRANDTTDTMRDGPVTTCSSTTNDSAQPNSISNVPRGLPQASGDGGSA